MYFAADFEMRTKNVVTSMQAVKCNKHQHLNERFVPQSESMYFGEYMEITAQYKILYNHSPLLQSIEMCFFLIKSVIHDFTEQSLVNS